MRPMILLSLALLLSPIPAEAGQLRSVLIYDGWYVPCGYNPISVSVTLEANANIRQTLLVVESVAGVWYDVWAAPASWPGPYAPLVINAHGVIHQSVEWHQYDRRLQPDYVSANGGITLWATCAGGSHLLIYADALYVVGTP